MHFHNQAVLGFQQPDPIMTGKPQKEDVMEGFLDIAILPLQAGRFLLSKGDRRGFELLSKTEADALPLEEKFEGRGWLLEPWNPPREPGNPEAGSAWLFVLSFREGMNEDLFNRRFGPEKLMPAEERFLAGNLDGLRVRSDQTWRQGDKVPQHLRAFSKIPGVGQTLVSDHDVAFVVSDDKAAMEAALLLGGWLEEPCPVEECEDGLVPATYRRVGYGKIE